MEVIPGVTGAEGDDVIDAGGACESRSSVIISIAVSSWASVLEDLRVRRRFASVRISISSAAAELRLAEGVAGALARHALPTGIGEDDFQIRGAETIEVDEATGRRTIAARGSGGGSWRDEHGKVVAVNEADVEEIHATASVEGELRKGGGRGRAAAGAINFTGTAVAGDAGEGGGGLVGGAVRAAPQTTGPGGRDIDGARFAGVENEASGG
ncbi:hypothetical protein IEQ34_015214 [Dendrobium chrysotoxum]|uniref:Uncharacterized protein n=1 Tax=Dendrobium chrysotoxum TaxID=161865 RepID=A0AAV7GH02_DENCH|nr:hypothetical protein IEQ34_015214 [Dendrobium chrysotoxum]